MQVSKFSCLLGAALLVALPMVTNAEDGKDCVPDLPAELLRAPRDSDALLRLGDLFYNGGPVEQNYRMAYKYYKLAAQLGDATGKLSSGEMLATGLGTAPDVERGRALVKEAADGGSVSALVTLGDLHARGNGGPMDAKLAVAAYEAAAKAGNARAMLKLADIYRFGQFSTPDRRKALAYYELAAGAGESYGLLGIGSMYMEGQGGTANAGLRLLEDAAKAGVEEAVVAISDSYFRGGTVPRNSRMAIALLNEAASAGNMTAARALIAAYRDGKLNRNKYVFRKMRSKAKATLVAFAGKLPAEAFVEETFLLKVAEAGTTSFAELYNEFMAFPERNRLALFRESRDANLGFYTYVSQRMLSGLGLYTGPHSGKLSLRTLKAMVRYCRRTGTDYFCRRHPPATGYYGELLSFGLRSDWNAAACPEAAIN
jgi:TPR repeat protein